MLHSTKGFFSQTELTSKRVQILDQQILNTLISCAEQNTLPRARKWRQTCEHVWTNSYVRLKSSLRLRSQARSPQMIDGALHSISITIRGQAAQPGRATEPGRRACAAAAGGRNWPGRAVPLTPGNFLERGAAVARGPGRHEPGGNSSFKTPPVLFVLFV